MSNLFFNFQRIYSIPLKTMSVKLKIRHHRTELNDTTKSWKSQIYFHLVVVFSNLT
jgi:hypothetical protein